MKVINERMADGWPGMLARPPCYRDSPYVPTAYQGDGPMATPLPIVHHTYLIFVKKDPM